MKILFLTRYGRLGASSRVRLLQYLPTFERLGWSCDVSPLFSDAYVRALYAGGNRVVPTLTGFARRASALLRVRRYDLIWVEKELLPFLPAFAEWALERGGIRYAVDYDDAVFHRYDMHRSSSVRTLLGRKIDDVMRRSAVVVAGNAYLAERARKAGATHVEIVPTVVDLDRYAIAARQGRPPVIGWIGSPATSHYVDELAVPLAKVQRRTGARVRLIGVARAELPGVDVELVDWQETLESDQLGSFDIGIMPLPDSPWERGKCGYKLIQYMACALPVVASPVGASTEIVQSERTGLLASSALDWERALERLIGDADLRVRMGDEGRARVDAHYSLRVQAPRLVQILSEAAAR